MRSRRPTAQQLGGTGLGLAIAQQLCEMMGGTIELMSESGQGSTFRFTARFRKLQERPPDSSRPLPVSLDASAQPESIARLRVLLVEDNTVNLEIASGMLENFGCRVDTARNGREALESHTRGDYDLICMDCQVPDMDGF